MHKVLLYGIMKCKLHYPLASFIVGQIHILNFLLAVISVILLQDENSIPFPSQDIDDFEMMMREKGESTHQYPTGR